ncbi:lamin tail domain-containing protein [Brevibacillus borstelensis]|uniref:lamin tail domain-containing protein n=1 Tax=Brevibacillus borstelensis TaxID=45462 RepID=UPI003CEDF16E
MNPLMRKGKRSWRHLVLAAVLMIATVLPFGLAPKAEAAVAGHVVISEIYGAGGNSGATYQHDYVELYNPSGQAVSLNNWSVQYAAADRENWLVTPLSGSISAHSYYLVRLASGGANGSALPSADATGGTNISATRGKVALVSHATALSGNPVTDLAVIDFVGYGTANAHEGESPAPAPSAAKSIVRKSSESGFVPGKGSAWDTDHNGADFLAWEPQPQNSQSSPEEPGEGGGEPGGEVPEVKPISEVRTSSSGTLASVQGIVTAAFEAGGKTNVFLQDETAGMLVRAAGLGNIVRIGDEVRATGKVNDYYGLPQIEPASTSDVVIVQENAGVPEPQEVISTDFSAAAGEQFEAELVTIKNVTAGARDSKGNVTLTDPHGAFIAKPYDAALLKPGAFYERLTGVVTYDFNEYKLVPRLAEDVIGDGGSQPDALRIRDIQGKGHRSPYEGANVSRVEGIVTAVVNGNSGTVGFYMQDPEPDNDPRTSEGIYVYEPGANVRAGDRVEVSGAVKEYVSKSREATDLTLTEIDAASVAVKERGLPLPAPVVLGEGDYPYPKTVIDNDSFSLFDPEEDGIDFWESLEGMLVRVDQPRVVGATKTFANPPSVEFVILSDKANPDKERTPAGGIPIAADNYNPERITIADKLVAGAPEVKVGDAFAGPIVGVIDYSFANFKLYNTEPLPAVVDSGYEREVTTLEPAEDRLSIATYNIENFSARDNADKINGIAESIVHNLKQPDIVGVVEMQDNNGPEDNGVTDASQSGQALIDAIVRAGGAAYRYVDIAPENKKDGGQPGGNIRVGFLYNPERVSLADRPAGDAVTAVQVEAEQGTARLSHNPGRIDPLNPAFHESRKPLAAEFIFDGKPVFVIANHFNSKGGDDALFGVKQPPVLVSEQQRVEIAKVVNGFVKQIYEADPEANVVVLGDFNDFQFSRPLQVLEGDELTNMITTLPLSEQYTYNYQGNAQVLDHILVSNHLAEKAKIDIVHINADFTKEDGRVSDHDPVLVQIKVSGSDTNPGDVTLEKQKALNRQAAREILSAADEESVLSQADLAGKSLQKLIGAESVQAEDKWAAIEDTIQTVLKAVVEQTKRGIVDESTLSALTADFLQRAFEPAIRSGALTDDEAGQQALGALQALLGTVVLSIDEDERTVDLLEQLHSVAETLLAKAGVIAVERGEELDAGDEQVKLVLLVLEALDKAFDDRDEKVGFEPSLSIQVLKADEEKDQSEAAVTLGKEVTERLAEIEATARLEDASGAWVLLSKDAIDSFEGERLGITVEPSDSPEAPAAFKAASEVYTWELKVNGEPVKSLDEGAAMLGIPVKTEVSRNVKVFLYENEKWKPLTDKKGNPARVTLTHDVAVFTTEKAGPLVLGEEQKEQEKPPVVRALIVKDRNYKLKPGEEAQLQVTANLGNGGKHDVTRDAQIEYVSDHPELVAVSDEGLIQVSDSAKDKDKAVITITYGGKSVDVQVSVKKK